MPGDDSGAQEDPNSQVIGLADTLKKRSKHQDEMEASFNWEEMYASFESYFLSLNCKFKYVIHCIISDIMSHLSCLAITILKASLKA